MWMGSEAMRRVGTAVMIFSTRALQLPNSNPFLFAAIPMVVTTQVRSDVAHKSVGENAAP
jgi:hypothetical protein